MPTPFPIVITRGNTTTVVHTSRISIWDNEDGTYTCTIEPEGESLQWQVNGVDIPGATTNPFTITATPADVISCVVVPEAVNTFNVSISVAPEDEVESTPTIAQLQAMTLGEMDSNSIPQDEFASGGYTGGTISIVTEFIVNGSVVDPLNALASGDEVFVRQTVSNTEGSTPLTFTSTTRTIAEPVSLSAIQDVTESTRSSGEVTYSITPSNGVPPYTISTDFGTATATQGKVPLNVAQDRNVTVTVTDAIGATASQTFALLVTPGVVPTDAPSSLIAEWDTTGNSSQMDDISGNGLDALFGAGAAAPTRVPNEGLFFNGANYARVPETASYAVRNITNPLHVVVFRRQINTAVPEILLGYDNGGNNDVNRFQVRLSNNAPSAVVRSQGDTVTVQDTAVAPLNEWLVGTVQLRGQVAIIRVNGQEVGRVNTKYTPTDASNAELTFGCRQNNDYSEFFQGSIAYAATYDNPAATDLQIIEQRAREVVEATHGILIEYAQPVPEQPSGDATSEGSEPDTSTEAPVAQGRIAQETTLTGGRPAYTPKVWNDIMADAAANNPDPLVVGSATRTASQSGVWSDTATWGGQSIPGDGDIVVIPMNRTVTYDVESNAHLTDVRVSGGTLTWATDTDTSMVVDTISTTMMGRLIMGEASAPITNSPTAGKPRAKVVFKAKSAPGPTPRLGMMTMGLLRMHGAAKAHSLRLATDPQAGSTVLTVSDPADGWRVGDTVLIPSTTYAGLFEDDPQYTGPTRYYDINGRKDREQPYGTWRDREFARSRDEVRTITAISGNRITLNAALDHDHPGYSQVLKSGRNMITRPIVSMLSHSIRFESDTPKGDRGHLMFMSDDTDCRYAECKNMGRTRVDPSLVINSKTSNGIYDKDPNDGGVPVWDFDNVRGRYPWHFHNTGPFLSKKMGVLECVSTWAPSDEVPQPGNGIVHHGSRAAIEKCVVYNVRAGGIVSELGNEIGQWLDCVVSWCRGDGFVYDWGMRAEGVTNHNGHMGAAYDCQARQILMQRCWGTSSQVGAIYLQNGGNQVERAPQDVSLRLRDPFTLGGLRDNNSRDDETYGTEQAQIPDWDDNVLAGCTEGFVVAHRQYVDLSDETPMLSHGYRALNVKRPFVLINYSYNYWFYDFHFVSPTPGSNTGAGINSDKAYGMSFINGHMEGFGRLASLRGLNYRGVFVDVTHDISGSPFSDWHITNNTYNPQTSAGAWNAMGPSQLTSQGWRPSPQQVFDSDTDYPLRYPNAGTPGRSDYPIGLDLPSQWPPSGITFPSFVLDGGCDLQITQTGTRTVNYTGVIYDAMGIRRYPNPYVYSPNTRSARTTHVNYRSRYNANGTGKDFVLRNGCFEETPGNWKVRMWHEELDRPTGKRWNFAVDLTLVGTWDQQLLEDNRVDPNATRPVQGKLLAETI